MRERAGGGDSSLDAVPKRTEHEPQFRQFNEVREVLETKEKNLCQFMVIKQRVLGAWEKDASESASEVKAHKDDYVSGVHDDIIDGDQISKFGTVGSDAKKKREVAGVSPMKDLRRQIETRRDAQTRRSFRKHSKRSSH